MEPKTDKSYVEAGPRALGWMIAEVFAGMKEKGMSTREALEVLKAYVTAIARGALE